MVEQWDPPTVECCQHVDGRPDGLRGVPDGVLVTTDMGRYPKDDVVLAKFDVLGVG